VKVGLLLTWDQLRAALESVDAEDRILLESDMTDALRPSELFALRWKCFDPETSSLDLQETVYRGKLRNHGKTKKSLAKIHISSLMVSDLQAWKIICPGSSPEAFIFPNREGGVRDPNNFRKRVLGQSVTGKTEST
jgi:integrase